MARSLARHRLVIAALVVTAATGTVGTVGTQPVLAGSHSAPTFHTPSRADDPAIGDAMHDSEPATVVAADGTRYVAYQLGSQLSATRDGGRTWSYVGGENLLTRNVVGCTSGDDVGDVELAADRAGRVYFADLQVTAGGTLDNGVQPIVANSDDHFTTYTGTCAAHQPASVDREWMAAWTPPGATSDGSDVYLTYHDFGPNTIWVNASRDGGRTWGTPVDVVQSLGAAADSFCDTVPAGIAVDPRNGWVYAAWTAGHQAVDNTATGCNYTQGAVFSTFYVAVSKDGGATWTPSLAFSGPDWSAPEPSDLSEIFGSIAVDRQGGVYVAFPAYLQGEYDAFYAYSPPADALGALHFTVPRQVSGPSVHTSYFVRVVAGDSGRVDVIYLGSPVRNVVVTAANKLAYDGSDPSEPNCAPELTDPSGHGVRYVGKPCMMPADAPWYLYLAQSLNATSTYPSFTTTQLRPDPVHVGDICTLGIFCLGADNRDLADTNDVRVDATGGAQVAYTWENQQGTDKEIDFQCQSGGAGVYAGTKVRDCQSSSPYPSGG